MRAVARSCPSGVFRIGRDPFEPGRAPVLADKHGGVRTHKLGGSSNDRRDLHVLDAIDRPEDCLQGVDLRAEVALLETVCLHISQDQSRSGRHIFDSIVREYEGVEVVRSEDVSLPTEAIRPFDYLREPHRAFKCKG